MVGIITLYTPTQFEIDDCYGKVSYFPGSHTKSKYKVDKMANSAMKEYTNEKRSNWDIIYFTEF